MTFTITADGKRMWGAVIGAATALGVEEIKLGLTPEGVVFRTMDPSHVALVDALLGAKAFAKYEVDKPLSVTLRTEDVAKMFNRLDGGEVVEMEADAEDGLIRIRGRSPSGGKLEYRLHTLEPVAGDTPLPKLTLPNTVSIERKVLLEACRDVQVVGDHVKIAATRDLLMIWCKGDLGEAHRSLEAADGITLNIVERDGVNNIYSTEYLVSMLTSQNAESVTVNLAPKMPMRIDFNVGDREEGKISFYLAPRIEET